MKERKSEKKNNKMKKSVYDPWISWTVFSISAVKLRTRSFSTNNSSKRQNHTNIKFKNLKKFFGFYNFYKYK